MASTDKNLTWIKLYRSLLNNDLYTEKPYDRLHAWIDLLLLAEHKTHKKIWRGQMTEFKRGDVNWSMKRLAERWGWSRGKVERFLSALSELEMVHLNVHRNRTIITIEKWDFYQGQQTSKRTSERTSNDTSNRTSDDTTDGAYLKNNIKNDKESKEYIAPLPDTFDDDDDENDLEKYPWNDPNWFDEVDE